MYQADNPALTGRGLRRTPVGVNRTGRLEADRTDADNRGGIGPHFRRPMTGRGDDGGLSYLYKLYKTVKSAAASL